MFFKNKLFHVVSFLLGISILTSDVYYPQGHAKFTHQAFINFNILFKENKPEVIRIPIPPSSTSSLFINQSITKFHLKYNTKPESIIKTNDSFGNSYYLVKFVPVLNKGRLNTISYEARFDIELDSVVYNIFNKIPYPINPSNISKFEHQFLEKSLFVDPKHPLVYNFGSEFTKNNNNILNIIENMVLFINNEIKESALPFDAFLEAIHNNPVNRAQHDSALVLQNKQGSFFGKMNLLISLFRSIGVPARYVYGYQLPGTIEFNNYFSQSPTTLLFGSEKSQKIWLEIFLPQFGWLPIDLEVSALMLPPFYLKMASGSELATLFPTDLRGRKVTSDYTFTTLNIIRPKYSILHTRTETGGDIFSAPINIVRPITNFYATSNSMNIPPSWNSRKSFNFPSISEFYIGGTEKNSYGVKVTLTNTKTVRGVQAIVNNMNPVGGNMRFKILAANLSEPSSINLTTGSKASSQLSQIGQFVSADFLFKKPVTLPPGEYMVIAEADTTAKIHLELIRNLNSSTKIRSFRFKNNIPDASMFGNFSISLLDNTK